MLNLLDHNADYRISPIVFILVENVKYEDIPGCQESYLHTEQLFCICAGLGNDEYFFQIWHVDLHWAWNEYL
jgi:hypothetical protein